MKKLTFAMLSVLVSAFTFGCGTTVQGDDGTGGTGGGVGGAGAGSTTGGMGGEITCGDLSENECVAEPSCEPGYSGMCDCTCPGPAGYEGGGCDGCEAECFTFVACVPNEECPDPSDPEVTYYGESVGECAAILYQCPEGSESFSSECGCGCIGATCPDPNDPAVTYYGESVSECAAIDYQCPEGSESFSSECGCGCIANEACLSETNPQAVYYGDVEECTLLDFVCPAGSEYFSDACGCGCVPVSCPDPSDPGIWYAGQSPSACTAIDFGCNLGQLYFDNECGCGCIDGPCMTMNEPECSAAIGCEPQYGGICDCECANGEPGCAECPASCFFFAGCQ